MRLLWVVKLILIRLTSQVVGAGLLSLAFCHIQVYHKIILLDGVIKMCMWHIHMHDVP